GLVPQPARHVLREPRLRRLRAGGITALPTRLARIAGHGRLKIPVPERCLRIPPGEEDAHPQLPSNLLIITFQRRPPLVIRDTAVICVVYVVYVLRGAVVGHDHDGLTGRPAVHAEKARELAQRIDGVIPIVVEPAELPAAPVNHYVCEVHSGRHWR